MADLRTPYYMGGRVPYEGRAVPYVGKPHSTAALLDARRQALDLAARLQAPTAIYFQNIQSTRSPHFRTAWYVRAASAPKPEGAALYEEVT